MQLFEYKLINDEKLGSYLADLTADKIVLNDYFYFSKESFEVSQNIYSEQQVGRILALTDREYFDLIQKYLSDSGEEKVDEEKIKIKQKIDEINEKISKSKAAEEATKKATEVQKTLDGFEKDMKSYDELVSRINSSSMDLDEYKHLSQFNLQKIHDDLVNINRQIDQYEEDLISKKISEIKETKSEYEYDSGKIGLASGIAIGIAIFGVVFYLVNVPLWISISIWGFAVFVFLLITFFSRSPKNYYDNGSTTVNSGEINQMLDNLKSQRDAILQFIGVKNTDDFFLMKAKFSAAKKNYDFMLNQQKDLEEKLDLEKIKQERSKLQLEMNDLKAKSSDEILSSEKYLELYRELDSLKLKLGNDVNSALTKDDIPKRLADIRKELSDKLPSYAGVLKSTFERSFDKVLQKAQQYIPSMNFSKNLSEWDNLSDFQRFVLMLSLAQEVYVQNFCFVLEDTKTWNEADQKELKNFIELQKEASFDLYLLNL